MTLRAGLARLFLVVACGCDASVLSDAAETPETFIEVRDAHDRSAPIAVDDVIDASGVASIVIAADAGVLRNDLLHSATVASFGPAMGDEVEDMGRATLTVAGGVVELAADGGLRYTPPPTLPSTGTDTFRYTIRNSSGSDTASVTMILGCGSETCNGCCQPDGTCEAGTTDDACGAQGETCAACSNGGTTCEAAVCVNTSVAANGLVDDAGVHMGSAQDAQRMRRDVIRAIWGERGFPFELMPTTVDMDVESPLAGVAHVQRVDRLRIATDHGFSTNAYVFRPTRKNRGVVIWHQGHSHDLAASNGATVVQGLVTSGFTVIAIWMPLYGESRGPVDGHDAMMQMEVATGSAMRFFLEPTIAAVNWAVQSNELGDIAMMGISGGGWTTTMAAALDPRIRRSVPVAGTLPLGLREPRDRGDLEQNVSSVYRIAGYLDLYTLGALEPGREQLQVLNRSDNCCFSAGGRATYEPIVRLALEALSITGTWRLFIDDSQDDHRVSTVALDSTILPFLIADEETQ